MKSCADLQETRDASVQFALTFCRRGDLAQYLEQRGFPGSVPPDNPEDFPLIDGKIHIPECPESLAGGTGA